MLGVDADDGVLGLVTGRLWTRAGRVRTPHAERALADRESLRRLSTAEAAKAVLAGAAMVTEVSDRESDICQVGARAGRELPQQGLQLEDSQLERADRPLKLTAIAAKAACIVMQLVQARDGKSARSAEIAFTPAQMQTLQALLPELEGRTALQKNPHPSRSLAWAAWIIAKLGGWDGYPKSKPPGPITFRHGLEYFGSIARAWSLRNV